MAKVNVFCSYKPEVSYIFRCNNIRADFHGGIFGTSNEDEIKELTHEIATRHPDFYLPEKEEDRIVDEELLNPVVKHINAIRAQAQAELIAQMKAGGVDFGNYTPPTGAEGIQNSSGIAPASVLSGTAHAQMLSQVKSVVNTPVMISTGASE